MHHIEELFRNGKPNYPVKRTLLTTGALAFLMDSRIGGHLRLETPDLSIAYDPPECSGYARGPMPVLCPWCPGGRYTPARED